MKKDKQLKTLFLVKSISMDELKKDVLVAVGAVTFSWVTLEYVLSITVLVLAAINSSISLYKKIKHKEAE